MNDIQAAIIIVVVMIVGVMFIAFMVHREINRPVFEVKKGKLASNDCPDIVEAINKRIEKLKND